MRRPPYPRGITRDPIPFPPRGLRVFECAVPLPESARADVARVVSSWDLKRSVGFDAPVPRPAPGAEGVLALTMLGVRFIEPVRVVWADDTGFGYETMPGHPLYGEESFRLGADGVFVARSISCAANPWWRLLTPALRLMQRRTMTAYMREVRNAGSVS